MVAYGIAVVAVICALNAHSVGHIVEGGLILAAAIVVAGANAIVTEAIRAKQPSGRRG